MSKDRDVGQSDNEAHPFDTEFLDDTSDTHALWFGFWKGIRKKKPTPEKEESMKELHYFQLGWVLGTVAQGLVLILLLYTGWANLL